MLHCCLLVSQKCMDSFDVRHELFSYYYKLSKYLNSGLHHVELLETHQCSSVLKGWAKQPTNAKKTEFKSEKEEYRWKGEKKKKCGGEEVRVVYRRVTEGLQNKAWIISLEPLTLCTWTCFICFHKNIIRLLIGKLQIFHFPTLMVGWNV